jgi:transcription elongation regulator 1
LKEQQQREQQELKDMQEFEQQLEDEAAAIEAEAAAAAAEAARLAADAAAKRAAEAEEARMRMRAWTAHKSGDGQVYYHNTMTGESSWERPEGFAGEVTDVAEGPPVPVAQASVAGTEWYEVKCQDGRRYYFNHSTQETAWSMPAEVAAVKKKQAEEAAAAAERARQQAAEQRAKAAQQLASAAAPAAGGLGFGGPGPGVLGFGQPPPPGFWGNADALRRMHMQRMAEARAQGSGTGVGGGGVLTKEGRVQRFKQLLMEGGVNAFSFFAKVRLQLQTFS